MPASYRYRAWDGSQTVVAPPPEATLTALADALLSGSVEQALDRALHRGLTTPDGERLPGLDHLRDQLRAEQRRQEDAAAEFLRQLAEELAGAAGGDSALDPETRRLLEALTSSGSGARLLAGADDVTRSTLAAALAGRGAAAAERGDAPLAGTTQAAATLASALDALEALAALEGALRRVRRVEDVGALDPELVRLALGERAADDAQRLAGALSGLLDSGHLRAGAGGRLELSARALQCVSDWLLMAVFERLSARQAGDHHGRSLPAGHDLSGATRPYQFGDALTLDLSRTVLEAVKRRPGLPAPLDARDFAIFEREESSRAATVLAIDLSRSMGERGYLLAAKRLALALSALIRTRFPRDELLLLGFSETARALTPAELPRLAWDRFGFGTNIQDALRLGRALLATRRGRQRNLILITDGEPTARRDAHGAIQFNHPPTPETLAATYAEAERLRRDGVGLLVCLLSDQREVVRFADELARRAAGDVLATGPDDLSIAATLRYGRLRRG